MAALPASALEQDVHQQLLDFCAISESALTLSTFLCRPSPLCSKAAWLRSAMSRTSAGLGTASATPHAVDTKLPHHTLLQDFTLA